jgi:hypothetical protein
VKRLKASYSSGQCPNVVRPVFTIIALTPVPSAAVRARRAPDQASRPLPFPIKERVWERLAVWHLGASLGAFRIIALAKLSEFNTARQLLLGIALHSNTLLFVEQAERL